MTNISTTKMSSKGQVVIPEKIRKELNLRAGEQFIVVGDKDAVILKTITPPSMEEFDELMAKAHDEAKRVGMRKSDIEEAIREVRRSGK